MTAITDLPNEIMREILLEAAGDSPITNLRSARQVSKWLESHALPIMYESLALTTSRGLNPMMRHITFLESARPIAVEIKELVITGAGSDGQGDAFEFSIMGTSDVAAVTRVLPALARLISRDVFWSTHPGKTSESPFSSLTSVEFRDATLVTPGPFPANILQQLPIVRRITLSFSASSPLDNAFNNAIARSVLRVPSLEIAASLPFPADTAQAYIEADRDSLEVLSLEIIPVDHPPFWSGPSSTVSVAHAHLLQELKIAIAVAAFPLQQTKNHTWTYAKDVVATVPSNTPLITLVLDCSSLSREQILLRLQAFPTQDLDEIAERMLPTAKLHISLQFAANDEGVGWEKLIPSLRGWGETARRSNVRLGKGHWTDQYGPFSRFLPELLYEEHDHSVEHE